MRTSSPLADMAAFGSPPSGPSPEQRKAARRELFYRLVLVTVSTLLALLVGELGLRVHHAVRKARAGDLRHQLERSRETALAENVQGGHFTLRGLVQPSAIEALIFEVKPRLDGDFKGAYVKTNSWGFRGPEVELEKPADTFRIVGVGDSMMFGWGVNDEETYLALLERALNERAAGKPRFEALNLAVPGYNTILEVEAFASKGVAFGPDLVILHFFANDLMIPPFLRAPLDQAPEPDLYLLDLLQTWLGGRARADPALRPLLRHDLRDLSSDEAEEIRAAYGDMWTPDGFRRALDRLAALARERSIPVVVVLLKDPFGRDSGVLDALYEAAAELDFHLLDLDSRFRDYLSEHGKDESEWKETFWVSLRDEHPNALGHRLFADELLSFLVDRRLVPGGGGS